MLKLDIIKDEIKEQHFIISSTEPCRIEIINQNGKCLAYVYKGNKIQKLQHPCMVYDGNVLGSPIYGENENQYIK